MAADTLSFLDSPWFLAGNMHFPCYLTWNMFHQHQSLSLYLQGGQTHMVFCFIISPLTIPVGNPWTQLVRLHFVLYLAENRVLLLDLKLARSWLPLNSQFVEVSPWWFCCHFGFLFFEFYLNLILVPLIVEGTWLFLKNGRSSCKWVKIKMIIWQRKHTSKNIHL